MQAAYTSREESIRHCIEKVGKEVKVLSKQKLEDPDNFDVLKALRKEQTKVVLSINDNLFHGPFNIIVASHSIISYV